jgi:hypothetical protein
MQRRGIGLAAGKRQAATGELWLVVRAPPSRGREGTQSGRVSHVRNVGTPSGPRHRWRGKPTVRKAEFLGGNRMPKKRMPVAER